MLWAGQPSNRGSVSLKIHSALVLRVFSLLLGLLTLEVGTNRLSRNVGK